MFSWSVIIFEIIFQNAAQMIFAETNHMIQTLLTNRTDYSFHEWILPRTPGGCKDFLDLHASNPPAEIFAVDLVTIPQEKARRRLFWKGFDELLRSPGRCRMFCHIEVNDASAIVRQYN